MNEPTFVFDRDCGMCTQFTKFVAGHTRTRIVFIGGPPEGGLRSGSNHRLLMSRDQIARELSTSSVYCDGSRVFVGALGIGKVLEACGGLLCLFGVLIQARLLRPLAERVYEVIARNRNRLPGGKTCGVDSALDQAAGGRPPAEGGQSHQIGRS